MKFAVVVWILWCVGVITTCYLFSVQAHGRWIALAGAIILTPAMWDTYQGRDE